MKIILLSNQKDFAIIDDEDEELVSKYKWQLDDNRRGHKYAITNYYENGKRKSIRMHRLIMNPPKGVILDHINNLGLDNRKENLRMCNYSNNNWNRRKQFNGQTSSKYKGVCFDKSTKKWMASIRINRIEKNLGRFKEEKDAAKAYNEMAKKLFGEFAKLNEFYE